MVKNKKKKSLILVLMLFLAVGLMACGSESNNSGNIEKNNLGLITVEDDYGNIIQLDKVPEKIISLSPSTTEILFALGLDDEIVGVTDYCDYPEEALSKEKVGGFAEANLEKIISLGPDLVISSGNEDKDHGKILYDADIQVATFNSGSIEAVFQEIIRVGDLTGKKEEAEKLVKDLKSKKDEIVKEVENKPRKKVFYEVWHDPLTAAGKGSFMDELISLAGGENIAGNIDNPYPEYSLEALIDKNPEVYITTSGGIGKTKEDIKSRLGYENIDAIKNDRIFLVDENIVSRPGPRIIQALEIIANSIHSEN